MRDQEFIDLFAPMRGGLVVTSDVSQIVAGGSTGIMLGFIMKLKIDEWIGYPFMWGIGSTLVGIIIAACAFLIIEWIQSKSWAAFYDDVLPGRFMNSTGAARWYRAILNIFLLTLSILCAVASTSTSYWASEDASDAMYEDVDPNTMINLVNSSLENQKNYQMAADEKVQKLQQQIEDIRESIPQRERQAVANLGGQMAELNKDGNSWAAKKIVSAKRKAKNDANREIRNLESRINTIESGATRKIEATSSANNSSIQKIDIRMAQAGEKREKKETRTKWMLVIVTVGASLMFILSQTLLGLDRAISEISYQEQRQFAPKGFQMIAKYFDPDYLNRSGKRASVTFVKKKRGRGRPRKVETSSFFEPETETIKEPKEFKADEYKPKTFIGKVFKKTVGSPDELRAKMEELPFEISHGKDEPTIDGGTVTSFGKGKMDRTGKKWTTKKGDETRKAVISAYNDYLEINEKRPKASDVSKLLPEISYPTINRIFKTEGLT